MCLKNKPSGYDAKISVVSKSCKSFVHSMCVLITPEEDYRKSNSNVINSLCVDRKEREEISSQLTVSVFSDEVLRQAGGCDKTHKAGSGMIWSQLCILG